MKIVRVLTYEGDPEAIMKGLAYRAVRGERVLGNGVRCHEQVIAGSEFIYTFVPGEMTKRIRTELAAMPNPRVDMTIDNQRKTLSIIQACDVAKVCRRTMYNWINSDKVEYKRTAGGNVRIYEDSLWKLKEAPDGKNE